MPWTLAGSYCGPAPLPDGIWTDWNLDPALIASLGAMAFLLRRSPAGLAACAVLAVAFVSPLCALSVALFSARVVHHVLLVAVAAPLLARARPAGGAPSLPAAFLAATAALWLWHLPAAYDLALAHKGAYWAMQASLLGSAVWFWRAVLRPGAPAVPAILWTLASFMAMGGLGALLTFAPAPLYAAHAVAPLDWGIAPIQDQQLGGLLMWVPAGLPYAAIIAGLGAGLWRRAEGRAA